MTIDALVRSVRSATHRGLFRQWSLFKPHAAVSTDDLRAFEKELGTVLPGDLRTWLLAVGYGDLDDQLSFRREWIAPISSGQFRDGVTFA